MNGSHGSRFDRRRLLKGALGAGVAASLGMSGSARSLPVGGAWGIRAHDWHTLPLSNGHTVETEAQDLGGDLRLARAPDGTYEPSRVFESEVLQGRGWFNMVGMHWVAELPEGTSLQVEVRGSQDGLGWSPWATVGHSLGHREDEGDEPEETFTEAVEFGRARALQYRLTLSSSDGQQTPVIRRVTATALDALDSPTLADLEGRGRAIPFRVGNGAPPTARLIPREGPMGWGPGYIPRDSPLYWDPSSGLYPYEFVTIHHTAGITNPENPVATVRAIWYFHTYTRGWGDVGYQFLVDQYGNVYEGRAGGDSTLGGHAYRYNQYNCGVSLLGQFQPGEPGVPASGQPTAAALNSAMRLAALECAYHGFHPLERYAYPQPSAGCRPQLVNYRICGHRDWGRGSSCIRTSCPGGLVYQQLPALREQAAALLPSIHDFHLLELLQPR